MYIPNQEEFQYNHWISEFKSMTKLSEMLNFILVILYSLEEDVAKLFEAEIKHFEQISQDLKFMRAVKHRDAMIEEYAVEYFGKDYKEDDPFRFRKNTEIRIKKVELEIMGVLGRVIKTLKSQGIIISDEA